MFEVSAGEVISGACVNVFEVIAGEVISGACVVNMLCLCLCWYFLSPGLHVRDVPPYPTNSIHSSTN